MTKEKIQKVTLGKMNNVIYTDQTHEGMRVCIIEFHKIDMGEKDSITKIRFTVVEPIVEIILQLNAQIKELKHFKEWVIDERFDVFEDYNSKPEEVKKQ